MKMRFFDLAKRASFKSTHPQHKFGGVLVKKNRVVSFGYNKYKTNPSSNHSFKSWHCELDCILGIDSDILQGSELYLFRQTKSGNLALAKPCIFCHTLLKEAGIRKVHYTVVNSYELSVVTRTSGGLGLGRNKEAV